MRQVHRGLLSIMPPLQPLPQTSFTAARLREMAHELLLQAAALEALNPAQKRKRTGLIDPRPLNQRPKPRRKTL
ncbi:MAG: hypothetical protein PHZ02_07125 [Desulfocapsaceae bacterium]|nr:hypothetical protein [Desulfocapsaceae bacterium]